MTKHTINSLLIVFLFGGLFIACQNNNSVSTETAVIKTSYSEVEGDVAKTYASFDIEGMSCSKGCGSSITKCVKAVDGVIASEMDFDAERPVDTFEITYDPNKTSEKEIAEAIGSLYDGKFQVKEVEVVTVVEAEIESNDSDVDEDATIGMREFRLPNISDIFENLLR